MNARCSIATVALPLLMSGIVASPASAECVGPDGTTAAWFMLYVPNPDLPYENTCYVGLHFGLNTVTVRVNAVDFQKARFSIPDPQYGTIVDERWLYPSTGNHASGVELDLGACHTAGMVTLGEIDVLVPVDPPVQCDMLAHWAFGGQVQSCSGRWLSAGGVGHNIGRPGGNCCSGWQTCYPLPYTGLYPADGATNVSTSVILSWVSEGSWRPPCVVEISADPACATMTTYTIDCAQAFFFPPLLQEGTTYYWRPRKVGADEWCGAPTPAIHSFTTGYVVSAERTTWGHVKAMYRN